MGGGFGSDSRTGSQTAMSAVESTCKKVTTDAGTLYDCQGTGRGARRRGQLEEAPSRRPPAP